LREQRLTEGGALLDELRRLYREDGESAVVPLRFALINRAVHLARAGRMDEARGLVEELQRI
jgi:hypothetical protein